MIVDESVHVLFIDGNGGEREYYAERLRAISPHYVTHGAASGETGLAFLKSNHVDCVVLEIALPDMSGFAVLTKLVPVARRPQIPVIILTRLYNADLLTLAVKNGALSALQKTMTSGDLLDRAILRAISTVQRDRKKAHARLSRTA